GVAGTLVRSMAVAPNGTTIPSITNLTTDHRTPIKDRWGGWYVSGFEGAEHLGNMVVHVGEDELSPAQASATVPIVADPATLRGYLGAGSDAAALMVFDHQTTMMNFITRIGWDA